MNKWRLVEGSPYPLGVTWNTEANAYNFALYSQTATALRLLLYASNDLINPVCTYTFDPYVNKSDDIWHCRILLADAKGAALTSAKYKAISAAASANAIPITLS